MFARAHRRFRRAPPVRSALVGCFGALALACAGGASGPPAPLEDTMTHALPDGFHFEAPAGADITDSAGEATVRPAGWRTQRSPWRLRVQLLDGADEGAGAGLAEELVHEGRRVRFQRATEQGGSGGPLHVVEGVVFLQEGDGVFHLELSEQSESKQAPNEAVFWTVVQTLGR